MALGAMVVVGVAILVAITLLPVLIRTLGHRVEAGGVTWSVLSFFRGLGRRSAAGRDRATPGAPTFWERWTARVMRRPVRSVVLAGSFLLILAAPGARHEDRRRRARPVPGGPRRPRGQRARGRGERRQLGLARGRGRAEPTRRPSKDSRRALPQIPRSAAWRSRSVSGDAGPARGPDEPERQRNRRPSSSRLRGRGRTCELAGDAAGSGRGRGRAAHRRARADQLVALEDHRLRPRASRSWC